MSEENTSTTPTPEERLAQALADFQGKAKKLIDEINGHKVTLVDGTPEKPSIVNELIRVRDEAKTLAGEINTFHANLHDPASDGSKAAVVAVPEAVEAIRKAKEQVDGLEAAIKGYHEQLLGKKEGDKEVPGVKQDVEEKVKQLTELHSSIYQSSDPNQKPLSDQIGAFLDEFNKKKKGIEEIRSAIEGYQDELLGPVVDGQREGGVKGKVNEYVKELDELLEKHTKRQGELLKNVEELLAGASTAALGKAFRLHKESFDEINERWMKVFIGAILVIMAVPLAGQLFAEGTVPQWWDHLLIRVPIVGGAITLAWYASKQRSQNKRLQQEYAYKEDVAMIYTALKKEIADLGESELGKKLKEDVLNVLVTTVADNPSVTLDSASHNDKGPAHEAYKEGMKATKEIVKEVVPKLSGLVK